MDYHFLRVRETFTGRKYGDSAATADRCLPGAIYNHMSATDETVPLPRLLPIVYQDRLIVPIQVNRLQNRIQINMDRLTQLQDTLDDVGDLCDKPTTLEHKMLTILSF
jgi:hypothetical protein